MGLIPGTGLRDNTSVRHIFGDEHACNQCGAINNIPARKKEFEENKKTGYGPQDGITCCGCHARITNEHF